MSFELKSIDMVYSYKVIQIYLKELLFFLSKEHLYIILLIYLQILEKITIPIIKDYNKCYISVIQLLISCNYLLTFRSEMYYLNVINSQLTQRFISNNTHDNIKESIIEANLSIINNSSFKSKDFHHNILLLTFYINSTLDYELSNDNSIYIKSKKSLQYIYQLIIQILKSLITFI